MQQFKMQQFKMQQMQQMRQIQHLQQMRQMQQIKMQQIKMQQEQSNHPYHHSQNGGIGGLNLMNTLRQQQLGKTSLLVNHPSSYPQLLIPENHPKVTMFNSSESVSKYRISQLAKEVVSGAKTNPFQAAPKFTMKVKNDLIKESKSTASSASSKGETTEKLKEHDERLHTESEMLNDDMLSKKRSSPSTLTDTNTKKPSKKKRK